MLSPSARATETVPLIDSDVSSVVAAESTDPWIRPTSSLMAVIIALVSGALVSTIAV